MCDFTLTHERQDVALDVFVVRSADSGSLYDFERDYPNHNSNFYLGTVQSDRRVWRRLGFVSVCI